MDGWRRLGLLFEARGRGLACTHAMLPTPWVRADRIRVFYAACDRDLRGRIFFADVEREPPYRLIQAPEQPVLDLGAPGAFDGDGVNPSQVLATEQGLVLLYIGWRRGTEAEPYTLLAGLAVSEDGGLSFRKQAGPLLPSTAGERLFRTAPFVERDGAGWRMLYIGGDGFVDGVGKRAPIYSLREARSDVLTSWPEQGSLLLAPDQQAGEIGFGRPVAWRDAQGAPTIMLSVRTREGYRLAHASRAAFNAGQLSLSPVLDPPFGPWEAQMTCFGAPCEVGERELLFYNGDGFGRTGVGLAWRPRVA